MTRFTDLRTIIGTFFLLTGTLLTVLSFLMESEKAYGKPLNFYAGLVMLAFGLGMLFLKRGKIG